MSLLQYLSLYAEPEASCKELTGQYKHVVVIPAFDEPVSFMDGMADLASKEDSTLWIVVVNCRIGADRGAILRTQYLLKALKDGGSPLPSTPKLTLAHHPIGDVLIVDRCSEGRMLPSKEGVGLARKIGCDIAVALQGEGRIESEWIHCTDADARLPVDYFQASDALHPKQGIAALTYPYWHETEAASPRGRALYLYELSLRYYTLGLKWAGSPYAFHCIGSTMAVSHNAYHQVRGVPKRQAGEDFYLLNKVAKLGAVVRPECSPILLPQRESARTPFGTGPATKTITEHLLAGDEFLVYHPNCFALLREWLDAMDEFATTEDLSILDSFSHPILNAALPLETEKRLREARSQCKSPESRKKRLQGWFDGFRTLKLIHALRDRGLQDTPWHEAFDAAPFVPEPEPGIDLRQAMAGQKIT